MNKKILNLIYNVGHTFLIISVLLYITILHLIQSNNLFIYDFNIILYFIIFIIFISLLFYFIRNKYLFNNKNKLNFIIQFINIYLIIISLILISLYFYFNYKVDFILKDDKSFLYSLINNVSSYQNIYAKYDFGVCMIKENFIFYNIDRITLISLINQSNNFYDVLSKMHLNLEEDFCFAILVVQWIILGAVPTIVGSFLWAIGVWHEAIIINPDVVFYREPLDIFEWLLVPGEVEGEEIIMSQEVDYFAALLRLDDKSPMAQLILNNNPNAKVQFPPGQYGPTKLYDDFMGLGSNGEYSGSVFFLHNKNLDPNFPDNMACKLAFNYISFLRKQIREYDLELQFIRKVAEFYNLNMDQQVLSFTDKEI